MYFPWYWGLSFPYASLYIFPAPAPPQLQLLVLPKEGIFFVCAQSLSCIQLFCNPADCSLPGSLVHGIFPGKNTRLGCHFLLQGIFPTQGSNPHLLYLLHWQVDSLPMSQLAISCSRVKAPTNLVFAQKLGQPLFSVKKGPVTTPHQGMELFLLDTYDNRL